MSLSTSSDDESFMQSYAAVPRVARRIARDQRRRERASRGSSANTRVAPQPRPPPQPAPPVVVQVAEFPDSNLTHIQDADEFLKWESRRRAGQIWCAVTRRYCSIVGARADPELSAVKMLDPRRRRLASLDTFTGRDFAIRLQERSHDEPVASSRNVRCETFAVQAEESLPWDAVSVLAVPPANGVPTTWLVTHGLGLRPLVEAEGAVRPHRSPPGAVSDVVPPMVLGTCALGGSWRLSDSTVAFAAASRRSVCGYAVSVDMDTGLPSAPRTLWGFHFREDAETEHAFTGPTASLDASGAVVALCDRALAWIQDESLTFINVAHATAVSSMRLHSSSVLVGKRSGDVLVVDSRSPSHSRCNHFAPVGRVDTAATSVVAQVDDLASLCSGVPLFLARTVDGRVVIFDARRSGKHSTPIMTVCEAVSHHHYQCDLSAGMVAVAPVRVGAAERGAALFSGGFHRLAAVDLLTGVTLLNADCDGSTYAAHLDAAPSTTEMMRPRFGPWAAGDGACAAVTLITPRRVVKAQFGRL